MTTARVPLIDETTGRFPDAYAPPSVAAAVTTVTEKASAAAASATEASEARDAAESSAATLNTWFLRGNGSPVGVITPSSAGVQYVDLAATNGARVWISTGTTSSAWRVVDGDTGWRQIESLRDENMWNVGGVLIRRTTAALELLWHQVHPVDGSGAVFMTNPLIPAGALPTGFNPHTSILFSAASNSTGGNTTNALMHANGELSIPPSWGAYSSNAVISTTTTWPTTLPGTAV